MAEAKKVEPIGGRLLALIAGSTADDVERLDAEIAAREADLESLRAVRRVIALKHGLAKPSGWKGKKEKGDAPKAADKPAGGFMGNPDRTVGDERREKIARRLLKFGPTTGANLCDLFNIPKGSIGMTMDHPWFQGGPGGYELSDLGRKAAPGLPA